MTANTIEGLRVNQFGVEGVKATATLTIAVIPTAAKTLIVGGRTYTFRAAVDTDAAGEVSIGANVGEAQTNLRAAINGDALNPANEKVSLGTFTGDDATLTARAPGTAGNSLAVTGTYTDDVGNSATAFASGAAAHGTAVAATSKIAIEKLEWGDDDENLYRPSIANGFLIRNRGTAVATQHGTRFSFSDQPMVWSQVMHWLSMGFQGNIFPLFVAGSPDVYRWTFLRSPTSNPLPNSFTIERRFSNGEGDVIDQRATYAMLSKLGFKYAANEHLRISGEGFARKFETSTLTAALSLPTIDIGVSALSKVYLDTTWAGIGGTLLSEQVIGWDYEFGTGFFPLYTAEGRTNLDFTKAQPNAQEVMATLKLTLLLDPTTYAAEAAAAAAGTNRFIQILITGGSGYSMKINTVMQHSKPSLFKIGEQDGQDVVELELEEATDETNFAQVIVDHPTVYALT